MHTSLLNSRHSHLRYKGEYLDTVVLPEITVQQQRYCRLASNTRFVVAEHNNGKTSVAPVSSGTLAHVVITRYNELGHARVLITPRNH